MGIDTSIYSNVQPVQVNIPSPLAASQQAMSLSQLGMQQMQMQRQMMTQQATQQSYAKNTDPTTGQLNQQGFLSDLGKSGFGQAAQDYSAQFAKANKDAADAQAAKLDAAQKAYTLTGPAFDYMNKLPEDDRAKVYPNVVAQLKAQGVDTSNMDHPYDPALFNQYYGTWQNNKQNLANMLDQANTGKSQAETVKDYAEAAKAQSETYKRPGVSPQTNDPAQLVPNQVPKDHQAAAFNEIDAAENTKRMSGSIMDSFNQAVQDTQGLGRVTSLIKTPRSTQALHQALQPTFKDLEGTVRQAAMDNTFKNVTPNAGDTAADIETKRQALQGYLQSKASAPTARGYGIDLSKFDSTSAYKSPPKNTTPSGGSGFVGTTANAGMPDPRDAQALSALKNMDASSPQAFQLRAILKGKGLLK